jgi:hypothetical protein
MAYGSGGAGLTRIARGSRPRREGDAIDARSVCSAVLCSPRPCGGGQASLNGEERDRLLLRNKNNFAPLGARRSALAFCFGGVRREGYVGNRGHGSGRRRHTWRDSGDAWRGSRRRSTWSHGRAAATCPFRLTCADRPPNSWGKNRVRLFGVDPVRRITVLFLFRVCLGYF